LETENIVIIGAGPAGIAAAIQLKRHGLEPVLFEKAEIGGLLENANLVENYPGFPEGIGGPKLAILLRNHLIKTGVEIHFEKVIELDYANERFHLRTDKRRVDSRFAIVASGTRPRKLNIEGLSECVKKSILYEIQQIKNIENEKIAIIGAGDAAFDYAINLSKRNEVVILNRGQNVKCMPLLFERASAIGSISYLEDTETKRIESHNGGLKLTCTGPTGVSEISVKYLVAAVGREPELRFLSENIKKIRERLVKDKHIYFIGDVENGKFRQTAIAVGDGIRAAMEISRNIQRKTE